jgi:Raf kinase inhibitor-like YbhB/YbcL family protein
MRRCHVLIMVALLVGCRGTLPTSAATPEATMAFSLTSPDFANGAVIPRQFTCDGADRSPALHWSDLPQGTRSLGLIVEDPDAPRGTFTHWVLYNLPPEPPNLPSGVPRQTELSNGARQGRNDFRRVGYGGPCPPRGPAHRYFFRMYALDAPVPLTPGATASELRAAIQGHVLGEAELMGTYGR